LILILIPTLIPTLILILILIPTPMNSSFEF